MKERVKEMRVFGCRLNFWQNVTNNISNKGMSTAIYELIDRVSVIL